MAAPSESVDDDMIAEQIDQNTGDSDYQYGWRQIGTFSIDFVKTDGERATVAGDLSRAFIKDHELLRASRRPREKAADKPSKEEGVEEMQTEMEEMSVKTADGIIEEAADDAPSAPPTDPSEQPTDSAFDCLPKSFAARSNKKNKHDKKSKKPKKNNNYGSFIEYWDVCSYWLLNSTWRWDFGHHMTAENLDELEKQLRIMKPLYSIEQHVELKENPAYHNVTAKFVEQNPSVTFEEVYEKHCELIKKQAEMDFCAEKTKSITRRCKNFSNSIQGLGFTPGFQESQFPANYDLTRPDVKREKPVIEDIRYTINEKFFKKHAFTADSKNEEKFEEVVSIPEPPSISEPPPPPPKDPSSIRFHFDPDTEQHLIASNAKELYANDPEICKYYYQRYRLFSKLDEGIIMDREGWFSVTPENVAQHIADRIVRNDIHVVVDAFTGVGGNAIQFALKGAHVIAIDMDPVRLKCARQNAIVYGVADYIDFICADFFDVAATWSTDKQSAPRVDAVFLSPPWGGPSYLATEEFDLGTGCTPNGFDIFDVSLKISKNIAYFLPRNTKFEQLVELSVKAKCGFECEQVLLNSKTKMITVYYGDLKCKKATESDA